MPLRKPNPFLPFYARAWARLPGAAVFRGKTVDLFEEFRKAYASGDYSVITGIEVFDPDGNGKTLWRDADQFANVPYKGDGLGFLSREEMRETPFGDDAELDRLTKSIFRIDLGLAEGEDTPEKRFFRYTAYERVVAAEMGQLVPFP